MIRILVALLLVSANSYAIETIIAMPRNAARIVAYKNKSDSLLHMQIVNRSKRYPVEDEVGYLTTTDIKSVLNVTMSCGQRKIFYTIPTRDYPCTCGRPGHYFFKIEKHRIKVQGSEHGIARH